MTEMFQPCINFPTKFLARLTGMLYTGSNRLFPSCFDSPPDILFQRTTSFRKTGYQSDIDLTPQGAGELTLYPHQEALSASDGLNQRSNSHGRMQ